MTIPLVIFRVMPLKRQSVLTDILLWASISRINKFYKVYDTWLQRVLKKCLLAAHGRNDDLSCIFQFIQLLAIPMVHLVCFHLLIKEELTLNVQILIIACFGVQQPVIIQLITDGETVCQTVG